MPYAIIVGGGKIGYYLARSLINRDFEVLLMEKDAAYARRLQADLGDVVMNGDGCDPLTLKNAGARRADIIMAATGDDADNLVVSQIAQCCFGETRVIARVNNPENEALFDKLGVHERVSGTSAVLNLLGQKLGRTPVVLLGALERSDLEIVEIILDEHSPFVGAKLSELQLPRESLVISVLREGSAIVPSGDTLLHNSDVMIVLVPSALEATLREFVV